MLLLLLYFVIKIDGQIISANYNLKIQPMADRTIIFNTFDTGVYKPIVWGLDLAWLSEGNIRRGINYVGREKINIVRSSFTPTDSLVNGDLKQAELTILNTRINIIKNWLGTNIKVALNCDHPSVHKWYVGHPERWAQLIDVTTRRHQEAGFTVISVAPFNEPDYGWGQGTLSDFYNIAVELRKNPRFDNIRISGGNTLNTDQALYWYNSLKTVINEGNTHQLAGSFDNYASFYQNVRLNGHHATNDELHNINDAIVGVEYGMQTGIWWGTVEYARAELMKASYGKRLGYAEHRENWTSAAVYRNPEGIIQAFGGTSERQAITTTYRFVCKDLNVYWDGIGPQREFVLTLPGGIGYQNGQTNAERVVNITWGEDIQPIIDGEYIIVNRASKKVIEIENGNPSAGANVVQNDYKGYKYQQWIVKPVDSRIGGDFSYFSINSLYSSKSLDVLNWSLDDGGNIIVWDDTKGTNQQWFLEYAEDGWFYIRSRFSAKCIEVTNSSNLSGANIQQAQKNGNYNQQWRFIPVNVKVEFNAPESPKNLTATPYAESIILNWQPSSSSDLLGYIILRADSNNKYNTIARNIKTTSFVDNSVTILGTYKYKVIAIDSSLNKSLPSNEVIVSTIDKKDLVVHLKFDGNTLDNSINLNHSVSSEGISYDIGRNGNGCISLNGKDGYIQLPYTVVNQKEITIMTWIYWKGGAAWQRIFDFGNGEKEYLYLTPRIRFAIKNNGIEQKLDAPTLPINEWHHIAITLNDTSTCIYLDGNIVAKTNSINIVPLDIKPVLNYIGKGQTSVPLFNGLLDDFRIYNYSMNSTEIKNVIENYLNTIIDNTTKNNFIIFPVPTNEKLFFCHKDLAANEDFDVFITDNNGKLVKKEKVKNYSSIDVSNLNSGTYILRILNNKTNSMKKFLVQH